MRHKSSSYKHPIRIERRTDEQNDYENSPETWDTVANAQAKFSTISDRERAVAQQQGNYYEAEFRIRYYPDINSAMRIVLLNNQTDRVFHIVSIADVDQEHFELSIMAIEKT